MKTQKNLILISLILLIASTSCFHFILDQTEGIIGQGPVVEQELSLDEFNKIENSSSINVIVEQGPVQKVLAVGHANIIDRLKTGVANRCWNISLEDGSYSFFELTIYVTLPEVESIAVRGSGDVSLDDFNQETNPSFTLSGSGNFMMDQFETANELTVSIGGSGIFYAQKNVTCFKKLTVRTSGSGGFNGFDLQVNECKATTSGSGSIKVSVSDHLDATISGSGDIIYKGGPRVNSSDNGSGNLRQAS